MPLDPGIERFLDILHVKPGEITLPYISYSGRLVLVRLWLHLTHPSRGFQGQEDIAKVWVPGTPGIHSQIDQASKTFMSLLSDVILWKVDNAMHVTFLDVMRTKRKAVWGAMDGLKHVDYIFTMCAWDSSGPPFVLLLWDPQMLGENSVETYIILHKIFNSFPSFSRALWKYIYLLPKENFEKYFGRDSYSIPPYTKQWALTCLGKMGSWFYDLEKKRNFIFFPSKRTVSNHLFGKITNDISLKKKKSFAAQNSLIKKIGGRD